ncbi:GNAT superfamily N-acetyltransferase [Hamadaea flava]|uniref:GNAT family N-acetyltransferase n=1 Tax=Hamadaea flava TaxID=1742688 RepID=A0ABV8LVV8_9ACTN|nr:GNAT family N-acetyltransferase [Hamadaea flava]MCP2327585.1 GNAT superfamily N-acetyltransferase [Hamadaea flava]
MPAYAIRPARAEDAATVAEIWIKGWADGHLGNVPDELVAVRTPDAFRRRAGDRVAATTVAVNAAGEIAGFVMVVADEVEQVYVAATHRGGGVAASLLAEAERQVAAGGHDRAWLAVVDGNHRARRFYERCGWSDDGMVTYQAEVAAGTLAVACHRYGKVVSGTSAVAG